jgi:ABC-type multidrug transport system fused ATPase/permease subunit
MKNIDIDKIIKKHIFSTPVFLHILLTFIAFYFIYILFPKRCGVFVDNIDNINASLVGMTILPFIIGHLVFYFGDYVYGKYIHIIQGKIINEIMNEVLVSIKENPQQNINKMNIITNYIKLMEIFDILHIMTMYFIPTFIMAFGLAFYFYRIDKKLASVSLILAVMSVLVIAYTGKKCLNKSEIRFEKDIEFFNEIRDVVMNMDNIYTDKNINFEVDRLNNIRDKLKKHYITSEIYNVNFKGMISIIEIIILFVLGGMLLNLYREKKVSKGDIIAYIYIILTLVGYYDSASGEVNSLFNHVGNFSKAKEYFTSFLNVNKKDNEIKIDQCKIEFKNINLKLGEKEIFKDLTLIIPENKKTGIIGEIGTGKSSLIKLLLGYHKYEGDILIDNVNIKEYKFTEVRKYIGYIPQHPVFFNRSIYENLIYGTKLTKDELMNILKEYNLEGFINNFPEKIDTIVKNNGDNLSGGQRQILCLIKIIILNKKIILMDEPTSSLDKYHRELFIDIVNKLKNKTIIIITHDQSIFNIFDNMIELKKS